MVHHNNVIIAAGIGLIVSDIIPTPADAVYFRLTEKWKNQLEDNTITAKQYWTRNALAYYGLNPLWWASVVGLSLYLGKNFQQKIGIGVAVITGGALIGVLGKNIKQDVERQEQKSKG